MIPLTILISRARALTADTIQRADRTLATIAATKHKD